MSMFKLAITNFKNSFKNYLTLIISLAFTVSIIFNFGNMRYSAMFDILGDHNAVYINLVVQAIKVIIVCFTFFYIWYATNVFLTRRKKEMGIYVFMGLTNQKIGKLYLMESLLIGVSSIVLGLVFGIISSQLFNMLFMTISDLNLDISFNISIRAIIEVLVWITIIYALFAFKGYLSIIFSSVLDLVQATKQNEYVKDNKLVMIIKALLGIIILGIGYYIALKKGTVETILNQLIAVILVVIGTYLVFGGLIPLIFQGLAKNKKFLYCKQRNIWINNIIFRIKKNYRTYAIVCILMICGVTALGTGFAMKWRVDSIFKFRNQYTYQLLTTQENRYEDFINLVDDYGDVEYQNEVKILSVMGDEPQMVISESTIKQVTQSLGYKLNIPQLSDKEYIKLYHSVVMSFITDKNIGDIDRIGNKDLIRVDLIYDSYLGYLQEQSSFFIVSDSCFEEMLKDGQVLHLYNVKLDNIKDLSALTSTIQAQEYCEGLVKADGNLSEEEWLKTLYTLALIVFMIFCVASGCIIMMKVYNDAYEEKTRYIVLKKIGISQRDINKAISKELLMTFLLPLLVMSVSSYFAMKSLSNIMMVDLTTITITSEVVVYLIFALCYGIAVKSYQRIINN